MPRLFTAIELPDDIRAELYRLHVPLPGARWMKPADYHLTLRFFGDIEGGTAHELIANLAEIEADAFELRICGLGAFGGNDPQQLWAGIEPSESLDALQRTHEKAARNAGLPPEKRSFKPHVTLARMRHSNADAVARFLTRYSGYRSEPFFVPQTVLMSSKPLVGGRPYAVQDYFALRGGAYISDDEAANW
jgi:RNA 2',3'-cyclic 3'-phosphodiesterase